MSYKSLGQEKKAGGGVMEKCRGDVMVPEEKCEKMKGREIINVNSTKIGRSTRPTKPWELICAISLGAKRDPAKL